ncbi:hypothetical protein ABT403_26295 [Streptomyces sp. NPDC000075]|uniref:hypothetical protein n=1 Tax=Streptomyces TaxID=1883 RepID=UPI0031D84AAB
MGGGERTLFAGLVQGFGAGHGAGLGQQDSRRDTTEAVVGAIAGGLSRPQLLILGHHDEHGRLRAVGRTVALHPGQARQVGEHLALAGSGHP